MGRIVSLYRDGFYLGAGALANLERGRNLTPVARLDNVLLRLRGRAATGGMDRAKVNRLVPGILIFEMPDGFFVGNPAMQFGLPLLKFQFLARGERKHDQRCETENESFHLR